MLRSLFTTLRDILMGIQQLIDEEPTIPTSIAAVKETALAGAVIATAAEVPKPS